MIDVRRDILLHPGIFHLLHRIGTGTDRLGLQCLQSDKEEGISLGITFRI